MEGRPAGSAPPRSDGSALGLCTVCGRTAGGYLAYSGRWSVQRTAEREEKVAGRRRAVAAGRKQAGRKLAGSST